MATPGELVNGVAKALGMSTRTVTPVDRELAVSGLRRSGGRGRSSVSINAQDAAALLVAMATPGTIKDTPERVRAYFDLPNIAPGFKGNHPLPLPTFSRLPDQHTFGQALSAILSDYAEDSNPFKDDGWYGSIRFSAPWKSVTIEFQGEMDMRNIFVYMLSDADFSEPYEGQDADFSMETRFTSDTLSAIGKLIADERAK